jgi:pimeloyl-ACP methyl ester carboxylesterase
LRLQMTLRQLVLAISAFAAALGVSGGQGQDSASGPSSAPTLNWASCGSSAPDFQCATIQAPLDYANPNAGTVTLAVIRHQATDPANRIGTLFFNPGGPGGAGTTELPAFFSQFPGAAVSRFDIISWDPRGVGLSTALQCFPNQAAETAFFAGVPSNSFPIGAAEQTAWISRFAAFDGICGQQQGNLLAHFSTTDTARDMDLLRQAVRDSTLTYLGISYGTYLGAVYANLFPGKVRAMVLDGVVDPVAYNDDGDGNPELSTGQRIGSDIGAAESLSAFLDQCGQVGPTGCIFSAGGAAGTHARFDSLLQRLKVAPATYKGFVFTPALLLTTAGNDLFFTRPVPQVATGWVGLATVLNDISILTEQSTAANEKAQPATANDSTTPPDTKERYASPFQQAAVECPESPNPSSAGVFRKLARITVARSGLIGLLTPWTDEICAHWPAVAADNYTGPWSNPTASTILVIGNTHDPSTPYANAVALSEELANSRLLTVEGYGHTALLNASACASQYEGEYLVNGTLPPIGTICAQTSPPF